MELVLAVVLVVLVIFAFLGSLRATVIASVAVPISLIGTFGLMYLMGYSLNNLSLMALTIATGFVVDDAIVMIENISRYIEEGEAPLHAADQGRDADRLHHHLADGLAGRGADPAALHGRRRRPALSRVRGDAGDHDPDLGGRLADAGADDVGALARSAPRRSRAASLRRAQAFFDRVMKRYDDALVWVIDHQGITLVVALLTFVVTVVLYLVIPKGLFPTQDTGQLQGRLDAAQDVSYDRMAQLQQQAARAILRGSGGRQPQLLRRRRRRQQHHAAHRQHADQPAPESRRPAGADGPPAPARPAGRRRDAEPAADAGPDHRRRNRPDRIPRLARRRRQRDDHQLDGPAGAAAADRAAGAQRQQRRRRAGTGGLRQRQPRHRGAPVDHRQLGRRRALQRLRPAHRLDHLHRDQPVPRHPRGAARRHHQRPRRSASST